MDRSFSIIKYILAFAAIVLIVVLLFFIVKKPALKEKEIESIRVTDIKKVRSDTPPLQATLNDKQVREFLQIYRDTPFRYKGFSNQSKGWVLAIDIDIVENGNKKNPVSLVFKSDKIVEINSKKIYQVPEKTIKKMREIWSDER